MLQLFEKKYSHQTRAEQHAVGWVDKPTHMSPTNPCTTQPKTQKARFSSWALELCVFFLSSFT